MLDQTRCDAPQVTRTNKRRTPTGRYFSARDNKKTNFQEGDMGMVMVKCPQTGHAIPTGIKTDRESFARSAVFFARTRCPICRADHAWFAREAWVREPSIRVRHRSAGSLA
jgi:hypothetical protein